MKPMILKNNRENIFMWGRKPYFTLVSINPFYNHYFHQIAVTSKNFSYLTQL